VQFAKNWANFGAADLGPGGFGEGRFDGLRNTEAHEHAQPRADVRMLSVGEGVHVVSDECRPNESA